MKIKSIASVILAGFLICVTNLNVFASEWVDYKDYYEEDLSMNIEEQGACYFVTSEDNSIQWTAERVDEKAYTSCAVYAREQSPNANDKDELCLPQHTEIKLIGISSNGWDIIEYQSKQYFMWHDYIVKGDVPKPEPQLAKQEKKKKKSEKTDDNLVGIKGKFEDVPAYDPTNFKSMGVINWNGYRWTYYSQRVLPGGGLKIPGRHVGAYGFVCDENEYICLASSDLKRGTVVDTPFGMKGCVYDCGCASGTLDCYCDW